MKYTGTFLTAALLAAATPAVPARAAGSPPIIDTAYWTEQPYCSGRYQLRLPAVRRVPNIATYFQRKGYQTHDEKFLAGDIVTWDLGHGLTHIGIVSDRKSAGGEPLILHNIGRGTREENILRRYKITGHYRLPQ